jgi:hypothetical protein
VQQQKQQQQQGTTTFPLVTLTLALSHLNISLFDLMIHIQLDKAYEKGVKMYGVTIEMTDI